MYKQARQRDCDVFTITFTYLPLFCVCLCVVFVCLYLFCCFTHGMWFSQPGWGGDDACPVPTQVGQRIGLPFPIPVRVQPVAESVAESLQCVVQRLQWQQLQLGLVQPRLGQVCVSAQVQPLNYFEVTETNYQN